MIQAQMICHICEGWCPFANAARDVVDTSVTSLNLDGFDVLVKTPGQLILFSQKGTLSQVTSIVDWITIVPI